MTQEITLKEVMELKKVVTYLQVGNQCLGSLGFTDHGLRHAKVVSDLAASILGKLGFSQRRCQLAAISGYLHDIGNFINRDRHGQNGALICMDILEGLGMDYDEVAAVVAAIGNHEEQYGHVVNDIGAALILADKSDVHRSRVRNRDFSTFDIHDRVNYAAKESSIKIAKNEDFTAIVLDIVIDTEISQVMEYFEIFLTRMIMCRRAATFLKARFQLVINNNRLL